MSLDIFFIMMFFVVVLSFIFIYSKGNWIFKLGATAVAAFISIYMVYSVEKYRGFPVNLEPDHPVNLISISVVQPDFRTEGGIYLWGFDDQITPRSYRIPYSEEKEEQFKNLKNKLAKGFKVVYNANPDLQEGTGKFGSSKQKRSLKDRLKSRFGYSDPNRDTGPEIRVIDPEETWLKKDEIEHEKQ